MTEQNFTAAADALVNALPTTKKLTATLATNGFTGDATNAITAALIGSDSVDLAVVLNAGTLGTSDTLAVTDTTRPALEKAASTIGTGVLGDVATTDASNIFADTTNAVIFELSDGGTPAGWFAIRVRTSGGTDGRGISDSAVATNIGRISDVDLALTVLVGRTTMSIRDVLSLEPGAVVELDRSAGEPADILLNGRLIAHGEVVVIDQDYAVRVTRILDVQGGAS